MKFKTCIKTPYILYIIVLFALLYSCASIQQPQGGPRDETPPKVLKMTPKNLTTNFKAKAIVIEFDEYIKLQDQFKEFSISPETNLLPKINADLKKLKIEFQDTLESNTTYTLNFGKAIADVNESNALKNFTYVFSTGPQLDSLSISGKVINSLTGEPEFEALAFILPLNRDTLIGKGKPSIYTLTDSSGNFQLNNLKEGSYRLYALKEKGGDKIYQQSTDEIGFHPDTIVLKKNVRDITIGVFKEDARVFRLLERKLNTDGSISFAFNQKLKKPEIKVEDPGNLDANKKIHFNKDNDTATVWLPDMGFDSVKFAIKDGDKLLQNVTINRGKKDVYKRVLMAGDNLSGNTLNPNRDFKLIFNFPIEKMDLTKVQLLEDSIARPNFTLTKDSGNLLTYSLKYPWKNKRIYQIKLEEGAVTAIFNTQNKEIKKAFEIANRDDYGTLILAVQTPEKDKNYILEIVDEKKNVMNSVKISKDTTVTLANYKAGIYHARIVYDTNKNGKWNTGDVIERLQPEKIWYEPKELSIRANWDRKETIVIPK